MKVFVALLLFLPSSSLALGIESSSSSSTAVVDGGALLRKRRRAAAAADIISHSPLEHRQPADTTNIGKRGLQDFIAGVDNYEGEESPPDNYGDSYGATEQQGDGDGGGSDNYGGDNFGGDSGGAGNNNGGDSNGGGDKYGGEIGGADGNQQGDGSAETSNAGDNYDGGDSTAQTEGGAGGEGGSDGDGGSDGEGGSDGGGDGSTGEGGDAGDAETSQEGNDVSQSEGAENPTDKDTTTTIDYGDSNVGDGDSQGNDMHGDGNSQGNDGEEGQSAGEGGSESEQGGADGNTSHEGGDEDTSGGIPEDAYNGEPQEAYGEEESAASAEEGGEAIYGQPPAEEPNEPYIPPPESEDPLNNDEDTQIENEWGGDKGIVETVEDEYKSIKDDQNAVIIAAVLGSIGLILILITAQQMLENPDGCCGKFCRCSVAVFRIVCWPCRMICCCGGGKSSAGGRQGRASVSQNGDDYNSGYSHDLELT